MCGCCWPNTSARGYVAHLRPMATDANKGDPSPVGGHTARTGRPRISQVKYSPLFIQNDVCILIYLLASCYHLPVYVSTYLLIYPSAYLHIYLCTLPLYLYTYPPIYLPIPIYNSFKIDICLYTWRGPTPSPRKDMRDPEEKQAEAAEKPMDPQRAGHFENLTPSNCRAICREHDDFIVI